jgi:hypothetical protein
LVSTQTPRIAPKSSIRLPSPTASPEMLWPPPLIDTSISRERPKSMHATTSATPAQRTIAAGRRSIIAFQTERDSSYASLPGSSSGPRRRARSSSASFESNANGVPLIVRALTIVASVA